MKRLSCLALLGLALSLSACSSPPEEAALTQQNDIAIAEGLCTDLTVSALNKVQAAKMEEAAEPCRELQNLLKGRTCENHSQTFPEEEHTEKCDLALSAEKEKAAAMPTPKQPATEMPPVSKNTAQEMKACPLETMTALTDLKKMKTALAKKKSSSTSKKALKLCQSLNSSLNLNPCLVQDSKTKEAAPLNLKAAGLNNFCQKLESAN